MPYDFRLLLHDPLNRWYVCEVEKGKQLELCKISREPGQKLYQITTYYDGRIVFTGTLSDCQHWIHSHWTDRRYINNAKK